MSRAPIAVSRVVQQLCELGIESGGALLVPTAFSDVGPIDRGPWTVLGDCDYGDAF